MKLFLHLTLFALCVTLASISNFAQLNANRSGRLDREYAENGVGVYASSYGFGPSSVAMGDGSLLQVSTTSVNPSRFAVQLVKLLPTGAPDESFGAYGRRVYDLGYDSGGVALARQDDGKFLVGGSVIVAQGNYELDALIFRIHPNGEIDTSFGNNGVLIMDTPSPVQGSTSMDVIDDIHILPDGKVLATGTSTLSSPDAQVRGVSHARTFRLNPNGTLDTSFAAEGSTATDIGFDDYVPTGVRNSKSVVDPQGRLLMAVQPYFVPDSYSNFGCKILRYRPNGSLDPSFGQKGSLVLTPGQISGCSDFAFLPDGKILVLSWAIFRLNEDGTTDTTFAQNGRLLLSPASFGDLLVTSNGKMYVAGNRFVNLQPTGGYSYPLIRAFHPDGSTDLRFGIGGTATLPGIRTDNGALATFYQMHPLANQTLLVTGSHRGIFTTLTISRFTFPAH